MTIHATSTDIINVAVATHFLMEGFDKRNDDFTGRALYNEIADDKGGYLGVVNWMSEKARVLEGLVEKICQEISDDFPGVIQYELYGDFGSWLFDHPDWADDDFIAYADKQIQKWLNLPASPHPTRPPMLNPSQPVEVEKDQGKIMKISDLMRQLDQIQNDHGDLDVVLRGNSPKGIADADEVRTVKTASRRAVFIGKPVTVLQE
jgi:hypothetical protein